MRSDVRPIKNHTITITITITGKHTRGSFVMSIRENPFHSTATQSDAHFDVLERQE